MEELLNLQAEKDKLIAEIKAAFHGVSREGGVSWRGAEIADGMGRESEGSFHDQDTKWEDLVNDSSWCPMGGWSFLDKIGFRYYLPAGMIRSIHSCDREDLDFHLALDNRQLRDYMLEQWSLLDNRQVACVVRFLQFMIHASLTVDPAGSEGLIWQETFASHWSQHPEAQTDPYQAGFPHHPSA